MATESALQFFVYWLPLPSSTLWSYTVPHLFGQDAGDKKILEVMRDVFDQDGLL